MTYSITYTREALSDLIAISTYLRERNPAAAKAVIQDIETAISHLPDFPQLGVVSRRLTDVRRLVSSRYHYVVAYKVDTDRREVLIIAVFHPRQQKTV
ncbi:type II toxin-antitoxin system RelE/ParE family toxin [Parvularcula sp. IMCC14364]|uniref:type II toxin-antitoxin system RelE/ParE family toxin n=1 Tax=Parvularcula sp. IMCC14364 TaxID=3067902 RepID=UPI003556D481